MTLRHRFDRPQAPRVDHIGHLSSPDRRSWSWGACRDSQHRSRLSLQRRRTRPEKKPWRRCSGVHLAAPRCRRRPPAWPRHWGRRHTKQQRKTGTYTALPVATRWSPLLLRHPWRHLLRRRARPSCRHMKRNMILRQPGAWSAEPSGLLPGPCARCVLSPRIMPLVLREAPT